MLFVCLFAFNAIADFGTQGRSTAKKFDGTPRADSIEQQFINVKNQLGSTISAGMIVVWDSGNDDGASVTTSTTANAVPACMMVDNCSAAAFCKCQTYGYTDELLVDAAQAASAGGKAYISGSNAGYAIARDVPSTGLQDSAVAMFYDAVTVSAAAEAFLLMR